MFTKLLTAPRIYVFLFACCPLAIHNSLLHSGYITCNIHEEQQNHHHIGSMAVNIQKHVDFCK